MLLADLSPVSDSTLPDLEPEPFVRAALAYRSKTLSPIMEMIASRKAFSVHETHESMLFTASMWFLFSDSTLLATPVSLTFDHEGARSVPVLLQ